MTLKPFQPTISGCIFNIKPYLSFNPVWFYFRFDVKDAPRYGRLERLRGHGNWASTKRFYSRQLEKGKVRYVHTRSNPSADSFNFIVTVPSNPSSTTATPATSSSIVAYIQDTFKVDIISNVIRVRFDSFSTMLRKTPSRP